MKKGLAILSAIIFLVSFFLPFMSYGGMDLSLFTILTTAFQYGYIKLDIIVFSIAFILALIGLIMVIINKGTKTRGGMIAGFLALGACVLEVLTGEQQLGTTSLNVTVFQILAIGFYLMVISSIGMIVSHFLKE